MSAEAGKAFSRLSFDWRVSGSKELRTRCSVFSLIMLFTLFLPMALMSIPTSSARRFSLAARGPWGDRISSTQLLSMKFSPPIQINILSCQGDIV
jgi:hypothetical protein